MELIYTVTELSSDSIVTFSCKFFRIVPEIVPEETILQCERMSDLKLFPRHNSSCPNFIRLHFKATVFKTEHVSFLGEDARQESDNGPTQKSPVCRSVAAIKERVFLLAMTVDVTVDPNLFFFSLS